jgi:2-haloacid dehalogenase
MRLTDFTTLTFDCYGTLIDWETGIVEALAPWLARRGATVDPARLLAAFGRAESTQQRETPAMRYPELLGRALGRMAEELGLEADEADRRAFGASVPAWPAFEDSAEALGYLKRHYRLVVLSNVDRESFAGSNRKLGVAFDAVYTAEDIGSYKPDPRNFADMLDRLAALGVTPSEILHTAQSLFHDHVPARAAGLATCWIDRRAGRGGGWGATVPPPGTVPTDFRFTSLAAMVEEHRKMA